MTHLLPLVAREAKRSFELDSAPQHVSCSYESIAELMLNSSLKLLQHVLHTFRRQHHFFSFAALTKSEFISPTARVVPANKGTLMLSGKVLTSTFTMIGRLWRGGEQIAIIRRCACVCVNVCGVKAPTGTNKQTSNKYINN